MRNEVLTIEATEDLFVLPERGILGHHAQFDLAVLDTPKIDDAYKAQYSEQETRVRAKRRQQITTVTFPYNYLDTAGWHGDCVPVKLNWRDIRGSPRPTATTCRRRCTPPSCRTPSSSAPSRRARSRATRAR